MRGELLPIWSDMYREVWAKLAKKAPTDLFCELFRELNAARKLPLDVNTLADFIDNPDQARAAFRAVAPSVLETLARKTPGVTEDTLGKMCGQLHTWPHATVREAAKKIYGFRAYPGLGHGAQGGGALREIECRDLVALSVMMTALTPYLTDRIDPESVYRGAA